MQEILLKALGGTSLDYSAMIGESALARLHVVVRGERGKPLTPTRSTWRSWRRSWPRPPAPGRTTSPTADHRAGPEEEAPELVRRYASAFPEGYKADFPARMAVADLRRLEALAGSDDEIGMNLYEPYDAGGGRAPVQALPDRRADLAVPRAAAAPADGRRGGRRAAVRDRPRPPIRTPRTPGSTTSACATPPSAEVDRDEFKRLFQDAFGALWHGQVESDGFNALVLAAGLTWEQAEILRVYAKYLRQAGTTFSQAYIERVLLGNVRLARLLVRLFEARLDPRRSDEVRSELCDALHEEILGALDEVASLDEDRILRAYLEMIQRHAADQLLPDDRGRPAQAVHQPEVRLAVDQRAAAAPAEVRDVRLLAAGRGRAPALREGRPRRAALVGPDGGLPHRDPRAWSRRRW